MPIVTATVSPSNLPRQLSDGNALGTVLGQGPADLISFFNATPVAQSAGPSQAAVSLAAQAGVVATFSSTQSPTAVTLNTTVESALTVQSGTGADMLPAAGDLTYVNKPTAQAGLGMGNARISAAGVVSVNFSNFTALTVTPTASEVYKVVLLRGVPSFSPVLSPVAVAATAIIEQQFAVAGLIAGQLVQVSKPTAQTGLDIVGCRVIANNLLGITFANVTAASITPTAAETYTVNQVNGLSAANSDLVYGFNVGTVGAIGAGLIASGGSTVLTGILATDVITGIQKPTSGAAATNAAYPALAVPAANALALIFAGLGTGATPTGSEVYTIRSFRLNPVAPLLMYNSSLAPASVAASTTAEQTFTVNGLIAGTPVWLNKPTYTNGIGICGVRVSAANTLAVTYCNVTAAAITPPTETYPIGNFQVLAPGAGNSVFQTLGAAVATAINAMRSAMVSLGLMAGA